MSNVAKHGTFGGSEATALADRLRSALHKVSGGAAGGADALLLDTSSSMDSYCGANRRKIDELRKLAAELSGVTRRFTFASSVDELSPGQQVPPAGGGTNLALALDRMRTLGLRNVVLITDGQPDSEAKALASARALGGRVDVFYVGPDPAPPFLRELALASGGSWNKATLASLKELTEAVKVRLCIEGPKTAKPYCL